MNYKDAIKATPHVWAYGVTSNGATLIGSKRQPSLIPVWLADHIKAEGGTVNLVREGTAAEVVAQVEATDKAIDDAEKDEYERVGI